MSVAPSSDRTVASISQGLDEILGNGISRMRVCLLEPLSSPEPMLLTCVEVKGVWAEMCPGAFRGHGEMGQEGIQSQVDNLSLLLHTPFPTSSHHCAVIRDMESLDGRKGY